MDDETTPTPAEHESETPAPQPPEERMVPASEVQRRIDEAMAKAARKAEQEAEKRKRQEDEERLKSQNEFKTLSEQQAKRIVELEAQAAQVETAQSQADRYKGALTSILETQRANIPAPIISLLDRMDPVEQLEWIAANQDAVAPPRNGNGAVPTTPRASGQNLSLEQRIQQEYDAQRTRRR